MEKLFVCMFIGHLVGDYLLQTYTMAQKKWLKGYEGTKNCVFHCLTYSGALLIFCGSYVPQTYSACFLFAFLVFLTHFPIDHWSLGKYWITHRDRNRNVLTDLQQADLATERGRFQIGIGPLVYVMVDNTLHLTLLWLVAYVWVRLYPIPTCG